MMAAPLIMSNDLRTISPDAQELLQNRLLIYIDQDSLGIAGRRVAKVCVDCTIFSMKRKHAILYP